MLVVRPRSAATAPGHTEGCMSYETFIAKRYLRSGRFFVSVSTLITILGVTLGVAVVCFVMAMHNGFEAEIRSRLLGTTAHITIFPTNGSYIDNYRGLVDTLDQIPGIVAASPFIYYKAAIASETSGDGIIVRGIDPALERTTSQVADNVILGNYSFGDIIADDDTIPGMVIGKNLADRLGVYLGSEVVLYSLTGEEIRKRTRPRVARFYIAGIFESGMYEFDSQLAYISLPAAQKLFRTGDAVTAVHVKLDNIYNAEKIAPEIDSVLGYQYDIVPWNVLHRNIFTWIALEKLFLFLGFILIVLVAAFSIISTLVMLTMEKRAEIGILKTIGSTPASVRKIFVYNGLTIGFVGTAAGSALALIASWIQNKFHLISLPPDIYFVSYLPVDGHLTDYLAVAGVTFVICLIAALYPAYQASKLSVIEVLRR